MVCPVCAAETLPTIARCSRCGEPIAAGLGLVDGLVVEGTVEHGSVSERVFLTRAYDEPPGAGREIAPSVSQSLAVRQPSLATMLWRQPAVRAVARAGVGALALTLGMRVVRGLLARPHITGEAARAALPLARHLFDRQPASRRPEGDLSEGGGEVIETLIYMRQVVRRR